MNLPPLPREFALPMPADMVDLEVAVVLLFLLHILFVALMVGGTLLTVAYELRGRRDPDLDRLAREIGETITVNKSLAVVLGVGPLLVVNVLYTIYFYTANSLTGTAWIMIVPLVAVAFLLTYAHKYSWDVLAERKGLHIAIGGAATALFLLVPLVFLTNINLMLFPGRWTEVSGFLSALVLPNVLPRYIHFLLASVALTGLFLAAYFGRRGFPTERVFERLDRGTLRREFTGIAFAATALQLIAGPLLFFTLPPVGMSWTLVLNITAGATLAVAALALLWWELRSPGAGLGIRYLGIVAALTGTVLFMAFGRHLYREQAISAHRAAMADATTRYHAAVTGAQMRAATGALRTGPQEVAASPGERTFRAVCMGCHALDRRLVGPPVTEIASIYAGNPEGLTAWVRSPGKKRPDYPEMPPIRMSSDQYRAVAEYVLELGGGGDAEPAQKESAPSGA